MWFKPYRRPDPFGVAGGVTYDSRLLEAVAAGRMPPAAVVWRAAPCIAYPPRLASRVAELGAAPEWPLAPRSTGGGLVALDPGVVIASLLWCDSANAGGVSAGFERLAAWVVSALGAVGVKAQVGAVSGSMCAGRYDVSVGGMKIAGLAQRRILRAAAGAPVRAVLAHAFILVEEDPARLASCDHAAARLKEPQVSAERHVCLGRLTGAGTSDLADALVSTVFALR